MGKQGSCLLAGIVGSLMLAAPLHAQFGPPEPQGSGPKLSPPTVFPAPGTYPTTESVTLLDEDAAATIHYTFDGSTPTSKSLVYDPANLLFLGGIYVFQVKQRNAEIQVSFRHFLMLLQDIIERRRGDLVVPFLKLGSAISIFRLRIIRLYGYCLYKGLKSSVKIICL